MCGKNLAKSSNVASKKDSEVILEMKGITKRFPGVVSNDRVDFTLRKGEIHSILGENGAGKSTLMKILYGLYKPDEGEIKIWGKKVSINSPKDAIKLGIGLVPQHIMLVPNITIWENIVLGVEPSKGPFVDGVEAKRKIKELQEKFDMNVPLDLEPWQVSVGEKQQVEILRTIYRGGKILIMDEPTSMLSPSEKAALLKSMGKMARSGISSIPFITHKIPEVLAVSDRITILRKGQVTGSFETRNISREEIIRRMIGKKIDSKVKRTGYGKEEILKVEKLRALNDKGLPALKDVSLSVHKGEIFGIAGVAGNGQKELVEVIMSLRRATGGKVIYRNKDITSVSSAGMRNLKIAYAPGERFERGIAPNLSISENIALGFYGKAPYSQKGMMNYNEVNKLSQKLVKKYDIKTPNVNVCARTLSGGNLQKLILARELSTEPDFILAEEPTAGLDIGCQDSVHKVLLEEKKKGMAILLVSGDLDEVMKLSDRIAVMYEGEVVSIVPAKKVDKEEIGAMMVGKKI